MRAQLEKMKLTEVERQTIAEAEAKGEEFTIHDLDVLRVLNFGNPNFGSPSKEKLREMRLTPQEIAQKMMWEITGEAQYKPMSERTGFKLARKTLSIVCYLVALCVVIRTTHWLVGRLLITLPFGLDVALALPPAYLITLLWWLPLPLTGLQRAKSVLTTFFLYPVMTLNMLAGAVAGIWLIVLDQWSILIISLGVFVVVGFLFSAMCKLWFVLLNAVMTPSTSKSRDWIAAAVRYPYTLGTLGLCAAFEFWFFVSHATSETTTPILLLSYSMAVGILRRWAWTGQELTVNNTNILFTHQLGCILLMAYCYQNPESLSLQTLALWYATAAAIGFTIYSVTMLLWAEQVYKANAGDWMRGDNGI